MYPGVESHSCWRCCGLQCFGDDVNASVGMREGDGELAGEQMDTKTQGRRGEMEYRRQGGGAGEERSFNDQPKTRSRQGNCDAGCTRSTSQKSEYEIKSLHSRAKNKQWDNLVNMVVQSHVPKLTQCYGTIHILMNWQKSIQFEFMCCLCVFPHKSLV